MWTLKRDITDIAAHIVNPSYPLSQVLKMHRYYSLLININPSDLLQRWFVKGTVPKGLGGKKSERTVPVKRSLLINFLFVCRKSRWVKSQFFAQAYPDSGRKWEI